MNHISESPCQPHCHALPQDVASQVVAYARKRLDKGGATDFKRVATDATRVAPEQPRIGHDDVQLGQRLGAGSFSVVYEIKTLRKKNCQNLVLKVLQPKLIEKHSLFAGCAADLVKEGFILSALSHQNILSCRGMSSEGPDAYISGRHDALFLVLDKLEDTLSKRLSTWRKKANNSGSFFKFGSRRRLTKAVEDRCDIILKLAEGLKYLHSKRILHRDLKPDNIGFSSDGELKIFDFDIARILPSSEDPNATFRMTRRIGSPRYMSPECALGNKYSLKADVYTFGLLCFELLSLEKPYSKIASEDHDDFVFREGVRPQCSTTWPLDIQALLAKSWSADPSMRPTVAEIQSELQQLFPSLLDRMSQRPAKVRQAYTVSINKGVKRRSSTIGTVLSCVSTDGS